MSIASDVRNLRDQLATVCGGHSQYSTREMVAVIKGQLNQGCFSGKEELIDQILEEAASQEHDMWEEFTDLATLTEEFKSVYYNGKKGDNVEIVIYSYDWETDCGTIVPCFMAYRASVNQETIEKSLQGYANPKKHCTVTVPAQAWYFALGVDAEYNARHYLDGKTRPDTMPWHHEDNRHNGYYQLYKALIGHNCFPITLHA